MSRSWITAGVLLAGLSAAAWFTRRSHIADFRIDPVPSEEALEGPEQLAARVRYSEPFQVRRRSVSVELEGRALASVSLVEQESERPPAVAEIEVEAPGRGRFASVTPGVYRLRTIAEGRGPVVVRVHEGGISPMWFALAALLVLVPPALGTARVWTSKGTLR
ncbi:MAG: hypothetical protein AAGE52_04475 [Myxococcota bacterium]